MAMLPQTTINDDGNSTSGTPYAGPYTGPDTIQENGLTFLDITRPVILHDAIAFLQGSNSAPVQNHAYLISEGNVQNVVAVLYANQLNASNNQRVVPKLSFKPGQKLFIRAVQLTEASTAAAEATTLILSWSGQ
jgi:hypothetical protein